MRHTVDVMELCLTIATFAVINQSPQTISFFCSINTERTRTEGRIAACHTAVFGDETKGQVIKNAESTQGLKK